MMAGNSPRRSVRRTTLPTSGSHHSSASSNSSSRLDRNTRTSAKMESPRKSTPSGSLSSEPVEDTVAPTIEDTLQTRRRKRGQLEELDEPSKKEILDDADGEDGAEDDEAVRCICGLDEYPGPPQLTAEDKKLLGDSIEVDIITAADYTEDLAGFFLQCDICKVWQHGGCVGIKNEDMSPDEYFCELCRKDLHKVFTAVNGQKYSQYLPLHQSLSRTASRQASFSKDGTRSPRSKSQRATSAQQSAAKRRSTMNSRDAAYDEEEQLRQAIEASRGEKSGESTDGGTTTTRRNKRSRSDSEEKQESSKRQRTQSNSASPPRDLGRFPSQAESDEDTKTRNGTKKIRGAAARNHREKEMREEKERIRAEAANKRKGRAERRRVEESEPPEETTPSVRASNNKTSETSVTVVELPPSHPVAPDTPPAVNSQPTSHKKGGRPPHTRKGKVGRNQYTKDRDQNGDDDSPGRSLSRDVTRGEDSGHLRAVNGDGKDTGSKSHAARGRTHGVSNGSNTFTQKLTMPDLKRKAAWMLDFIAKTQMDMASEGLLPTSPPNGAPNGQPNRNGTSTAAEDLMRGLAGSLIPMLNSVEKENGEGVTTNGTEGIENEPISEVDFKGMKLVDMMDTLTRMLIRWQKRFA